MSDRSLFASGPTGLSSVAPVENPSLKAQVLWDSLARMRLLKGAIVVIKYGGSVIDEEVYADSILSDIAFLQHLGISVVVVHGGGKEISNRMRDVGIIPKFINGLRYTDKKTISIVDSVLSKSINPRIIKSLSVRGAKAGSLPGKKVLKGKKLNAVSTSTGKKEDLGFVGDVHQVNRSPILGLLKQGIIPVITPLAAGAGGSVLNINADIAAAKIASEIKATHLVFLSDVNGILEDSQHPDSTITKISPSEIQALQVAGVIHAGMLPKVNAAVDALKKGVRRVKMLNGQVAHGLLIDFFIDPSQGTEVVLESNK
jgi:acetylglutamate kinase